MTLSRWTGRAMAAGLAVAALGAGTAFAAAPEPWQMDFQPAATEIKARIHDFHLLLLPIITVISLFVLGLLIYVMVRFNARANPVPSKTSHNTLLEVVWTVLPILILVVIAIPSFRLLYFEGTLPKADMTIKVTGYQWYWGYSYPDHGGFAFDSYLVRDENNKPAGNPRLLETDTQLVVPVGKTIHAHVTASDVIHAWFIPAFGINVNAIPGRLNEVWFKVDKPGVYYGQCSKICGVDHSYMPIMIKAVTQEEFDAWVAEAKTKYAAAGNGTIKLADASASARQ